MSAHAYWRLYITANNGNPTYTTVAELEMRIVPGGVDQCAGGTAIASGYANPDNQPSYAFDNVNSNKWTSAASQMPCWIGYHLTAPLEIREIVLTGQYSTGDQADYALKDFQLEWSDDGLAWNPVAAFTDQAGWGAAEARTFTLETLVLSTKSLRLGHAHLLVNGPGRIADYVELAGPPIARVSRRVRLYDKRTGCLIAQTWSGEDGSYEFTGLALDREYLVIAEDYERTYNAVIADFVTAALPS